MSDTKQKSTLDNASDDYEEGEIINDDDVNDKDDHERDEEESRDDWKCPDDDALAAADQELRQMLSQNKSCAVNTHELDNQEESENDDAKEDDEDEIQKQNTDELEDEEAAEDDVEDDVELVKIDTQIDATNIKSEAKELIEAEIKKPSKKAARASRSRKQKQDMKDLAERALIEAISKVTITDETPIRRFGKVLHIIPPNDLVVEADVDRDGAHTNTKIVPVDVLLDEGSVVLTQHRQPIGVVADTFGPVNAPHYQVKFDPETFVEARVNLGDPVFMLDSSTGFCNVVAMDELEANSRKKGDDRDRRGGSDGIDEFFSDDETERMFKKKRRSQRGGGGGGSSSSALSASVANQNDAGRDEKKPIRPRSNLKNTSFVVKQEIPLVGQPIRPFRLFFQPGASIYNSAPPQPAQRTMPPHFLNTLPPHHHHQPQPQQQPQPMYYAPPPPHPNFGHPGTVNSPHYPMNYPPSNQYFAQQMPHPSPYFPSEFPVLPNASARFPPPPTHIPPPNPTRLPFYRH